MPKFVQWGLAKDNDSPRFPIIMQTTFSVLAQHCGKNINTATIIKSWASDGFTYAVSSTSANYALWIAVGVI